MLAIESFVWGLFQTNSYLVSNEAGEAMLIDPCCSSVYERQQLLRHLEINHLQLKTIVATHGHLDHLWGAAWATKKFGVPVLIHLDDIPMTEAMQQQYDLFGVPMQAEPFPVEPFASHLLPLNFQFIHTPGHTPGSICLYCPENHLLFSGDTLFRMGYGRTDLPGGNYMQLLHSLQQLFALPSDTHVYPGHGEPTTIGAETR